jgi:hypothetical protein
MNAEFGKSLRNVYLNISLKKGGGFSEPPPKPPSYTQGHEWPCDSPLMRRSVETIRMDG